MEEESEVAGSLPATQKNSSMLQLEADIALEIGFANSNMILTQIAKISADIPDSVTSISSGYARELSGRFLKGLDLCGELVSIATAYEAKMNIRQRAAHSEAMILRAASKGLKTAKEKEAYADTDSLYLEAADKHVRAKMFRSLLENKREDLNKAHYLMRKIAEEEVIHSDSLASMSNYEQNNSGGSPKVAVVDAIASQTTTRVPWNR